MNTNQFQTRRISHKTQTTISKECKPRTKNIEPIRPLSSSTSKPHFRANSSAFVEEIFQKFEKGIQWRTDFANFLVQNPLFNESFDLSRSEFQEKSHIFKKLITDSQICILFLIFHASFFNTDKKINQFIKQYKQSDFVYATVLKSRGGMSHYFRRSVSKDNKEVSQIFQELENKSKPNFELKKDKNSKSLVNLSKTLQNEILKEEIKGDQIVKLNSPVISSLEKLLLSSKQSHIEKNWLESDRPSVKIVEDKIDQQNYKVEIASAGQKISDEDRHTLEIHLSTLPFHVLGDLPLLMNEDSLEKPLEMGKRVDVLKLENETDVQIISNSKNLPSFTNQLKNTSVSNKSNEFVQSKTNKKEFQTLKVAFGTSISSKAGNLQLHQVKVISQDRNNTISDKNSIHFSNSLRFTFGDHLSKNNEKLSGNQVHENPGEVTLSKDCCVSKTSFVEMEVQSNRRLNQEALGKEENSPPNYQQKNSKKESKKLTLLENIEEIDLMNVFQKYQENDFGINEKINLNKKVNLGKKSMLQSSEKNTSQFQSKSLRDARDKSNEKTNKNQSRHIEVVSFVQESMGKEPKKKDGNEDLKEVVEIAIKKIE